MPHVGLCIIFLKSARRRWRNLAVIFRKRNLEWCNYDVLTLV